MCVYSSSHTHTHTQYCTIRHLSPPACSSFFLYLQSLCFFLVSGTWIFFFYVTDFIRDDFLQGFFFCVCVSPSAADVKDFLCVCARATVCEPCLAHFLWRKLNWMIFPHLLCQHLIIIITTIISMTPLHALAQAWASGSVKMVSTVPKYIVYIQIE